MGCYDSRLYCLDMRTGQIIWSFQAQVGFTVPYCTCCDYIQISLLEFPSLTVFHIRSNPLHFSFTLEDPVLALDLDLFL